MFLCLWNSPGKNTGLGAIPFFRESFPVRFKLSLLHCRRILHRLSHQVNPEHQRMNAFELCWRRLLKVPWKARRSNQLILKENNPEYSLESLMLKLQHFGHLCKELTHWKRPWCWEKLRTLGKGDSRGWNGLMASSIQWTWVWTNSRRYWRTVKPGILQKMGLQGVGHDLGVEQHNATRALNVDVCLF